MKHSFNKVLIVSLTFIGIRCGSNQSISKKASQEKGYVMGTITIIDHHPKFTSYSVNYKPIDHKINWHTSYKRITVEPKSVGFKQVFTPDYKIENRHVFLFFRKLEVGEHDFFNFELFKNTGAV